MKRTPAVVTSCRKSCIIASMRPVRYSAMSRPLGDDTPRRLAACFADHVSEWRGAFRVGKSIDSCSAACVGSQTFRSRARCSSIRRS